MSLEDIGKVNLGTQEQPDNEDAERRLILIGHPPRHHSLAYDQPSFPCSSSKIMSVSDAVLQCLLLH